MATTRQLRSRGEVSYKYDPKAEVKPPAWLQVTPSTADEKIKCEKTKNKDGRKRVSPKADIGKENEKNCKNVPETGKQAPTNSPSNRKRMKTEKELNESSGHIIMFSPYPEKPAQGRIAEENLPPARHKSGTKNKCSRADEANLLPAKSTGVKNRQSKSGKKSSPEAAEAPSPMSALLHEAMTLPEVAAPAVRENNQCAHPAHSASEAPHTALGPLPQEPQATTTATLQLYKQLQQEHTKLQAKYKALKTQRMEEAEVVLETSKKAVSSHAQACDRLVSEMRAEVERATARESKVAEEAEALRAGFRAQLEDLRDQAALEVRRLKDQHLQDHQAREHQAAADQQELKDRVETLTTMVKELEAKRSDLSSEKAKELGEALAREEALVEELKEARERETAEGARWRHRERALLSAHEQEQCRVAELNKEINKLSEREESLEALVEKLRGDEASLGGQVARLHAQEKTLKEQLQSLATREAALNDQVAALGSRRGELEEETRKLAGRERELGTEVKRLNEHERKLVEQVQELDSRQRHLTVKVQALEEAERALGADAESLACREAELLGQVAVLTGDKSSLADEVERQRGEAEEAREEGRRTGAVLQACQGEVEQLHEDKQNLQTQLSEVTARKEVLEAEVQELREDREVSQAEAKRQADDKKLLQGEVRRAGEDREALQAAVRLLKEGHETLRLEVQGLTGERDLLLRSEAKLRDQVESMGNTSRELEDEVADLKERERGLVEKVETDKAEMQALQEQKASLTDQMLQLQHEIEEINAKEQQTLQELESLKSGSLVAGAQAAEQVEGLEARAQLLGRDLERLLASNKALGLEAQALRDRCRVLQDQRDTLQDQIQAQATRFEEEVTELKLQAEQAAQDQVASEKCEDEMEYEEEEGAGGGGGGGFLGPEALEMLVGLRWHRRGCGVHHFTHPKTGFSFLLSSSVSEGAAATPAKQQESRAEGGVSEVQDDVSYEPLSLGRTEGLPSRYVTTEAEIEFPKSEIPVFLSHLLDLLNKASKQT